LKNIDKINIIYKFLNNFFWNIIPLIDFAGHSKCLVVIIVFVVFFFLNRFEISSLHIPKVEVEVTDSHLGFKIDRYVLHHTINNILIYFILYIFYNDLT